MTKPLLAALIAFAAAMIVIRLLGSSRFRGAIVDVPNNRSLHSVPTPRTGGIGLMLGAATAWLLVAPGTLAPVAVLAGLLALTFLIDDIGGLPVRVRFAAQFAAAAAFLWWLAPSPWLLVPLLLIGIVWSTNLYNFMDGSNGLAGGMALIGFGAYAFAAKAAGAHDIALLAAIVAGAAAGFLMWNFDPARIFLGDAGSIPLGFLAAALGVLGWHRGTWPFWLPLLVFAPFWVDATLTLFKRWLRGERLSEAHRTHYYQRLVQLGWSHRKLALAEYALMIGAAGSAVLLRRAAPVAVIATLAAWTVAFAWMALTIDAWWADVETRKR